MRKKPPRLLDPIRASAQALAEEHNAKWWLIFTYHPRSQIASSEVHRFDALLIPQQPLMRNEPSSSKQGGSDPLTNSILAKWRQAGHFIRHIDGNSLHNSATNLGYVTIEAAMEHFHDWRTDWDDGLTDAEVKLVMDPAWRKGLYFRRPKDEKASQNWDKSGTSNTGSASGASESPANPAPVAKPVSTASPAPAPTLCDCCGKGPPPAARKGLQLCSGCMSVRYCSKQCQDASWKGHKEACRAAQMDGRK